MSLIIISRLSWLTLLETSTALTDLYCICLTEARAEGMDSSWAIQIYLLTTWSVKNLMTYFQVLRKTENKNYLKLNKITYRRLYVDGRICTCAFSSDI